MVTNVTSFSRSGLSDFLLQRVTAVVLALYALCIIGFFLVTPDLSHAKLVGYFGSTSMQLFSLLAVLSTAAHAWIGMWTIGTDYLRPAHVGSSATLLRFVYFALVVIALFVYVVWAVRIFWSL
ncbi:MAG: succinate dehydrogenase, hydrophobic membrane anchor protein [Pseudomonadaceae bacterium]|nr:succinate dehydrogenase, hydrophobic membrane anchor protein [Pseudomonadaceae bacterium]